MERTSPIPSDPASALRLIVLAGRGGNAPDALAERFGRSHRGLIPLAGQPLIAHVLRTAMAHPRVVSLAICIEREAFEPVWDVLTRLPGRGIVALVPARADIADSVRDAAQGWEGPLIVTTADHALLSAESIDAVLAALERADVVATFSPRAQVVGAHRAAPRRFLSFRDGDYAACDIYGAARPEAVRAVEVFGGTRASDRAGIHLARALGTIGLMLMRCHLLTLSAATARASRHLGLDLAAVVLADGSQALDVNDDRSHAVARDLLDGRNAAAEAGQAGRRRTG